MSEKKMTVAVIGCGVISNIYLQNMTTIFPNLEVVACCDLSAERAQERSAQYNIPVRTYEDVLADPSVDMVIILTPAPAHYALIKQGLMAGKHVYTEKTMTIDLEQARELVALANEKGVYLGAAPDTFLGAAFQKARQVVDSGAIGEVTSFHVCANRCLDRLTCTLPFLRLPGGGICYDYGVYHLTALVSLLGPIAEVCAVVDNKKPLRVGTVEGTADFGKTYEYNNEAQVTATLRTESGIAGSFCLNGESIRQDLAMFRLYGTEGVLQLPDPNGFGGDVTLIRSRTEQQVLENDLPYADNSRGLGPTEMAQAIAEGRINRASKEQALHVLEVIQAMMESSRIGSFVKIHSRCQKPASLH